MLQQLRTTAGTALLAFAAIVAAPTASGAIITGSWDPALPENFGPLGWSATINVRVDGDCIRANGSSPILFNPVAFGGFVFDCRPRFPIAFSPFSIISAEVGIYDLGTGIIRDVLTFDADSFLESVLLLGPGSIIRYLSSTPSNAVLTCALEECDIMNADYLGAEFMLALPGADPEIMFKLAGAETFTPGGTRPRRTFSSVTEGETDEAVIRDTALRIGDRVVGFVPEPGSLALALLALGAAGAAASRRTRRADDKSAVAA